jgi:acetate kinase
MDTEKVLAKGNCERIGLDKPFIKHTKNDSPQVIIETDLSDHTKAMGAVISILTGKEHGVITDMNQISVVGHRVVHGGERFTRSVIIDEEVIKQIEACYDIAPLHNPPGIAGIKACKTIMPNTPMVAVFDTAFHQTVPKHAYLYALPYEIYETYRIRKYGFHGTSHRYVAERAAQLMGRNIEELNIVTCHLGNGSSICAVKGGKSIDTTMGFTPLAGLVMGTRCGDIDPAIVTFIMKKMNMTADEADDYMNKHSGMLGITGISSDFRDILKAEEEGNDRARIALDMFCYRVQNYIAQYAGVMGGLDAVVFTAGVGENNPFIRTRSTANLKFLGIDIDEAKNNTKAAEIDISTETAKVRTFVIATNEELAIARECKSLLS